MKALNKLKRRAGMTLTEVLVTVLLVSLMSGVIVVGIGTAAKVYRQSVTLSRAQTALSTLMEAVGDELRLATNVSVADGAVSYTSARKNVQAVSLDVSTKGELLVGGTLLVSSGVYSENNLKVTKFDLSYDGAGLFTVSLTLSGGGGVSAGASTQFRCLNYYPPAQGS